MKYRSFKDIISLQQSHNLRGSANQFKNGMAKKKPEGNIEQIKKRMPGGIALLK